MSPFSPEAIQLAIPENGVLIDFLEYDHSHYFEAAEDDKRQKRETSSSMLAIVLKRSGEPEFIELGEVAALNGAIDTWRRSFRAAPGSGEIGFKKGEVAGKAIRKQIWDPLSKHIADAKMVLVSTDGVLGRFPLAALPGKEKGTYLIEDHRLVMIPVPQLLPALANDTGVKDLDRALLLMGDVNYDSQESEKREAEGEQLEKKPFWKKRRTTNASGKFDVLENTGGEISEIRRVFEKVAFGDEVSDYEMIQLNHLTQKLTGKLATEKRFRELAPQFSNLHLATHGFFAGSEHESALSSKAVRSAGDRSRLVSEDREVTGVNPGLLSGLAFSGANRAPEPGNDDGILTSQEIAFLPLNGVDMVVLSACETGLGKVAGGEGLIGLQRAFQISGARSTIASLWKVDDLVTRRLMERFYRNLWEKEMSRLDALREAQLYILRDPGSLRSLGVPDQEASQMSPYYWAAFQLSGDWR